MIATLNTILFITDEKQEVLSTKVLQKGQAVSRLKSDYQLYHYTNFVPLPSSDTVGQENHGDKDEPDDQQPVQLFKPNTLYLVNGKFVAQSDGSLEITITYSNLLEIDPTVIPVSRPFVHLLGRVENAPVKTEAGYQLDLQVKPYLSKEQCATMSISLVHPIDGRFKNALDKTRRFSLVHVMGALVIHERSVYCEILEYQFVSTRQDESSNVVVPWRTPCNDRNSTRASTIETRIAAVHENSAANSKIGNSSTTSKKKDNGTKPADLAVTLLNKQNVDHTENAEMECDEDLSPPATVIDLLNVSSDNENESSEDATVVKPTRKIMPKRQTKRNYAKKAKH